MAFRGSNHKGGPPIGNADAKGNRGGSGRPPKYRPEFAERVTALAQLGCTDREIGECFEVSESVIRVWQTRHVEFFAALKAGRMESTGRVVAALFKRATGFSYTLVKGHKKVRQQDETGVSLR